MDTSEHDDKGVGEPQKGSHVVHVRADSDSELQALFDCVLKPSKQMPLQKPFKMRNLPASFFKPPTHRQSPAPTVTHSRESSADSTYGGGGGGPIRVGGAMSPAAPLPPAPQHFRHHSSPASLQQTFAVAQQTTIGGHAKQHSYDALSEDMTPLPPGWEQARTPQGQIYYLNHITQTTTWDDPRKKVQPANPSQANANQQPQAAPPQQQQPQQQAPQPQQQQAATPATQANPVAAQQAPNNGAQVTPSLPNQNANQPSPAQQQQQQPMGALNTNGTATLSNPLLNSDLLGPLPDGWEQAITPDGEIYFINHQERDTSWFDPRIPRRYQTAQMQKTPLTLQQQQQHSPIGSPNSQMNPQQQQQQLVGMMAPRSPSTQHLARLPLDNNRLKNRPNSPDARKKVNQAPSTIVSTSTTSTSVNNAINNNNSINTTNSTALLQLQLQLSNQHQQQQQQQQQLQLQQQQQEQQLQQQMLRAAVGGGGGDPFLSPLPTSDLHARQESADSGLGLGGGNGGANGSTSGSASSYTPHQQPTTPEDFLAAMEDVEITPSETRRDVTPSPAPPMMEANDLESMDSEDLVPTINLPCELSSDFLSEVIGANRMDNTWL